jgi:hypothetical protein
MKILMVMLLWLQPMFVQVTDPANKEVTCFTGNVELTRRQDKLELEITDVTIVFHLLRVQYSTPENGIIEIVYWGVVGTDRYVIQEKHLPDGNHVIMVFPLRLVAHDKKKLEGLIVIASTKQSEICK